MESPMNDVLARELSEERFKEWLSLYEDKAVVGRLGVAHACPLARYLTSVVYIPLECEWNVFSETVEIDRNFRSIYRYPLPKWCKNIIKAIDDLSLYNPVGSGLTKQEVLAILEKEGSV